MLVRLDSVNINNTKELLGAIMVQLNRGNRVEFLCERSRGPAVIQRVRVMLSRVRNALEAKGKRVKHFRLHSDIYRWTDQATGKQFDCVVVRSSRNQSHAALELLDDLMVRDESL